MIRIIAGASDIPIMLANNREDNMQSIEMANRVVKLYAICAAAMLISAGIGCGNATRNDSTSSTISPMLSIAGSEPAQTGSDRNVIQTAQQTDSPESANDADPELKSLVADLESNFQAWKSGKAYNFQPAVNRVVKRLEAKFDANQFELASDVANLCEITGSYGPERQIYTTVEKLAGNINNPNLVKYAREAARTALQKLDLLGTRPKIEGAVFGGGKLNWDDYKGKVVLLDFWATWCGPCREELPNVEKTYEKYHPQGFDVVGISLDDDRTKLSDFLAKEKLPWTILFDENPAKQGWDGAAMTKDFYVSAIPATYLIGRDGKVVSIYARGESLERQVKELLAKKP
jgi:peroxiredoxin